MKTWIFRNQYEFRFLDSLDSVPGFQELTTTVLGGPPAWEQTMLSEHERACRASLKTNMNGAIRLRIGVFYESELVAYTYAFQDGGVNLQMSASCVHPEHQRRGIYSELLQATLEFSSEQGFQTVGSNHRATNNPILIAKLRAGFVISGMNLSDVMGWLVQLTYFHNPERRKLMDARSGLTRPEGALRELFF